MSEHRRDHPTPGPIVRLVLSRRIGRDQWVRLQDELVELYEHRRTTGTQASADRWIRREYRRLAVRVLFGHRLDDAATARPAGSQVLSTLLQDARHSLRSLARAPLFSVAIVATVGLGIGGTSLVFAIVHSVPHLSPSLSRRRPDGSAADRPG